MTVEIGHAYSALSIRNATLSCRHIMGPRCCFALKGDTPISIQRLCGNEMLLRSARLKSQDTWVKHDRTKNKAQGNA